MKYTLDWLTNPEVFAVNRIAAHSDHRIYANHLEADADNSSLIQNLNVPFSSVKIDFTEHLPTISSVAEKIPFVPS